MSAPGGFARGQRGEGLVLFSSVRSLLGGEAGSERDAREAVRSLLAEGIAVFAYEESTEDRELFESLSVCSVGRSEGGPEEFARALGVPYWRTAAVGHEEGDVAQLERVSLPFWVAAEPFPGARGAVHLPRGGVAAVARRLLGAWLPEGSFDESRSRPPFEPGYVGGSYREERP